MNPEIIALFTKLFPESSVEELKKLKESVDLRSEYDEFLLGAIVSKEKKLYALTDTELNMLGDDNYKQQRYMRRSEDVVEDSCDENKKGFYTAWAELEEEEMGIKFEVSRRKFLDEREQRG